MTCLACASRDKKIKDLEGQLRFHSGESERWRSLWHTQRGGEVFNSLQDSFANQNVEISKLRLSLQKSQDTIEALVNYIERSGPGGT